MDQLGENSDAIWGTAFAVAILESNYKAFQSEWKLIARKAIKFLRSKANVQLIEVAKERLLGLPN